MTVCFPNLLMETQNTRPEQSRLCVGGNAPNWRASSLKADVSALLLLRGSGAPAFIQTLSKPPIETTRGLWVLFLVLPPISVFACYLLAVKITFMLRWWQKCTVWKTVDFSVFPATILNVKSLRFYCTERKVKTSAV